MYQPQIINLKRPRAVAEVADFLKTGFQINYGNDAQTTFIIREEGELIATASRAGNVFKYFGINPNYQGENLSGILLGALMDDAFRRGIYHYFIFTSPDKSKLFEGSGFHEIIRTDYSALLESGRGNINRYMDQLKEELGEPKGKRGSIVMNLNPMTLGHCYLIDQALAEVDELIIFLVEEDESVFPFKDRLAILKAAVAQEARIQVVPSGPYLISRATFPTYFLKRADENLPAYTAMDAAIFGRYYAKSLGITHRFVGEEPLDPVTNAYNQALEKYLAAYGLTLGVIPRKQEAGAVISASRVRRHLAQGDLAAVKDLVPEATWQYLASAQGRTILEKLKGQA